MSKDKIKNLLESYKFDNQLLNEKQNELNIINSQHLKKLEILKPISNENNQLYNEAVEKYKRESSYIEKEIEKILNKKRDIEKLIEKVQQPYKNVLYFKYVQCLSVEEIAMKMNYSPQRIYQLHDIGMKIINEKDAV